jgi:hypothetical protein
VLLVDQPVALSSVNRTDFVPLQSGQGGISGSAALVFVLRCPGMGGGAARAEFPTTVQAGGADLARMLAQTKGSAMS